MGGPSALSQVSSSSERSMLPSRSNEPPACCVWCGISREFVVADLSVAMPEKTTPFMTNEFYDLVRCTSHVFISFLTTYCSLLTTYHVVKDFAFGWCEGGSRTVCICRDSWLTRQGAQTAISLRRVFDPYDL